MEHTHFFETRPQLMKPCAMCDAGMKAIFNLITRTGQAIPITEGYMKRLREMNMRGRGDEIAHLSKEVTVRFDEKRSRVG